MASVGDVSESGAAYAAPFSHSAADTAPTSTIAAAMLFGTITFASASLAARTWLTGDARAIRAAFHPKSSPLDVRSFSSVYTLLHHFTVMGFILLFAYVCEYHPPFPHSEKSYDRDEFYFLVLLLFIASAYTVHRNDPDPTGGKRGGGGGGATDKSKSSSSPSSSNGQANGHAGGKSDPSSSGRPSSRRSGGSSSSSSVADVKACNDVLNRDQTEEWKGWMQFIFLMYHYYHAEEVYNSIRIMITCYVWMTGFGNFSFFYLKGDYSAIRVLQMLWRLNFLVLFLCLSQGTTYILYYICPLHTYFFLMVYVIMRVGSHLNYTKYGIRFKLACAALIIFFLWDVDSGLFQMVHFPFLGTEPIVGATAGSMWEWYFRTTLDHWSTFLGMVFALNYPITSLFYRKLESRPWRQEWMGKGAVAVALIGAFYVWATGPFMRPKIEYNATNSYFGFIPLIAYIYLRNLTPTLRSYSLNLLHQIGKTTLETYLMQHHIWLTSDAKSLLTLIPGWPKANMLVVTFIYFYVSRRLYRLTLFLRGMLLPDKSLSDCLRSLGAMTAAVSAFYGFALILAALGITSLTAVAIVSVASGTLLYQTVMDATWAEYRESAPSRGGDEDDGSVMGSVMKAGAAVRAAQQRSAGNGGGGDRHDSAVARLSPPLIGTLVLLVVGLTWHGMAETGAGKIQPLRAECEAFANDGMWIPLDGCDETSRGAAYRDGGISAFAACGPGSGAARVWGWNDTAPYTHCRFRRRDVKSMKKALKRRSVVYVGDSMTRNLYYAQLRSLGVADAGRYDATLPKHSDVFNTVGSASVDFRWAPLAVDQLAALRDINSKVTAEAGGGAGGGGAPDLLVLGGGAWDRLHVYATDEDQKSHRQTVRELAQEMRKTRAAGTPVAWVVPTTINTPALNTEDKRDHMREEDMEEMRGAYANAGVLSASSFVLDGPSFTADRVADSYDGVHYPARVYDAGAQILANAMDWLLPEKVDDEPFVPPSPGKMANPFLGMMMLCFVFIGLMFFDGFMGFSYLASLFVRGVMPNDLYEEAFTALHRKMKLPASKSSSGSSSKKAGGGSGGGGGGSVASSTNGGSASTGGDLSRRSSSGRSGSITPSRRATARSDVPAGSDASSKVDEEIVALLGPTGADLELGSRK